MPAVFIAQSTLQEWADAGKVRLEATLLTLLKEQREVNLTPAVRFTEVLGGEEDPHGLMGKVKTKTQLDELQAEHYMDSVICGDVAYKVVEGFLGDLMAARPVGQKQAPAPVEVAQAPAERQAVEKAVEEAEAAGDDTAAQLSRLFLDTVN
jgi:hypothetical protein